MSMTRMRHMRRLLPLLIGLLILVAIGFLPVSLPAADDTNTEAAPQGSGTNTTPLRPIGEIDAGGTAAQEFPAAGTKISTATLLLTTYQRANSGAIQVMLQTQANGRWQTLGSQTMQKADLRDNALTTVTFDPPLRVQRGQIVRIVLQADGDARNAISWQINPSSQMPGFALFLNGDPQPGTAQFQISYAPASGRLGAMIGPVWARITVFLDPLWRVILAAGILVLLGGFFVLGRYLPGRAPACLQPPSFAEQERQGIERVRPDAAQQGVDR
jgi:hypothetical protein